MEYILGVNAYHPDVSAALLRDGELIAAVEEERFQRVKHWNKFPVEAIRTVLKMEGIEPGQLSHIAISRNARANLGRKVAYTLLRRPDINFLRARWRNTRKVQTIEDDFAKAFGDTGFPAGVPIHGIEHHPAHLASAFFVSPYDRAALLSVDGFGDFVSTSCGMGEGNKISLLSKVYFPHSLGMLYTAVTRYLGFLKYGDEYKVMGLAPYGKPRFVKEIRKMVEPLSHGRFRLKLPYFLHWRKGSSEFEKGDGVPGTWPTFSEKVEDLLGPTRKPDDPVTEDHQDIAASLQRVYEEMFFHVANELHRKTQCDQLCLAGGCGLNSVANGKVFDGTPFKDIYVQPAAGDNGTSLGAAYYVWHQVLGNKRSFVMEHALWGPEFDAETQARVAGSTNQSREEMLSYQAFDDADALCKHVAELISQGKIIGWFQGRMEWGPRALGNRSILADPRRSDMREIINAKIKFREKFRPFAPSILEEKTGEYFEKDYPDPFMLKVYPVREEKRAVIPAVTHVDGSGRLQTVSPRSNALYYQLIQAFDKLTGVPVVLNTSFNENEPIVHRPQEAVDCFLRTSMDVLVLGSHVIERK